MHLKNILHDEFISVYILDSPENGPNNGQRHTPTTAAQAATNATPLPPTTAAAAAAAAPLLALVVDALDAAAVDAALPAVADGLDDSTFRLATPVLAAPPMTLPACAHGVRAAACPVKLAE